jgi:hypothetical protein
MDQATDASQNRLRNLDSGNATVNRKLIPGSGNNRINQGYKSAPAGMQFRPRTQGSQPGGAWPCAIASGATMWCGNAVPCTPAVQGLIHREIPEDAHPTYACNLNPFL